MAILEKHKRFTSGFATNLVRRPMRTGRAAQRRAVMVLVTLPSVWIAGLIGGSSTVLAATDHSQAGAITQAQATTFLVPSDPFPTIQSAIDFCQDGDAVEVAPGTYRGPGNRDLDFRGTDLRLYSSGGADVTIIDCEGSPLDPHQGVVFDDGETLAASIEGFTFIHAYALGKGSARKGGAIFCREASQVTLRA